MLVQQLTLLIAFWALLLFNLLLDGRMATLTNEEREDNAVAAARAARPVNPPPMAYEALVAPYLVWAAIRECGIQRFDHRTVSDGLFHD